MANRISPKQERLFQQKFSLWILINKGHYSMNQVATLMGVSRMTLYRFLNSVEYESVDFFMRGRKVLEEVHKVWPELNMDTLVGMDKRTQNELTEYLHEKYPMLF